jgi:phosphoglycolate phosphatase
MIKLVAFDWNGTVLSDTNTTLKAECATLMAFGKKPISLKRFQATYEIPIINYWARLGFKREFFRKHAQRIDSIFYKVYERLESSCRTRSGVREVLSYIEGQKIKPIIFSNHGVEHIQKQLDRLGIKFSHVIGREKESKDHLHIRSKEQKLCAYVDEQKFIPAEVVVVGDTDEEIAIGKKYGYHTVALTGGYQSVNRLKLERPDYLIHNLVELKKIIIKLNHV